MSEIIGYPKEVQLRKKTEINTKRLSKADFKKYEREILDIGNCQLCSSYDLDKPHHALFGRLGADKNDKFLVAICVDCHRVIHNGGLNRDKQDKNTLREIAIDIGLNNWKNASPELIEKYGRGIK